MGVLTKSSRPRISISVLPKIPATLRGTGGIGVDKSNGIWTVGPRWDDLTLVSPTDLAATEVWIRNTVSGAYARSKVSSLLIASGGIPEAPTDGQLYSRRGSDASWQVSPSGSGGIPEAPTDGNVYNRRGSDASWQIASSGGGIPEAPNDGASYFRQSLGWSKNFIATGGTTGRTIQQHAGDVLYVEDFGAVGDGVADDTAAIQAAINAAIAGGGAIVRFGPKGYKFTSTLNINGICVSLVGEGRFSTVLSFVPTINNDIAIDVSNGANIVNWTRLAGFTLYSPDTTFTKTGVQATDVDFFEMDDICINGNVSGAWGATGGNANTCIAIRTRGRDFITIRDTVQVSAEKPMVISQNPNNFISFDHSEVHAYLGSSATVAGGACILIDDNVYLSNCTFTGALILGKGHGVFFNDTTGTAVVAQNVKFTDMRCEGADVTAGVNNYSISFAPRGCHGLVIENVGLAINAKGIFLRKCTFASIENVIYPSTSLEGLNADSTVNSLNLESTFWNVGSTANVVGMNLIWKGPNSPAGGPLPGSALYSTVTTGFVVTKFTYTTVIDGDEALFENTSGGSTGSVINLFANSASPAAADTVANIKAVGKTDTGATATYSQIFTTLNSPVNATYNTTLNFQVYGGAAARAIVFQGGSNALFPTAGAISLGIAGFPWNGLHLTTRTAINWNSGKTTLTEAADGVLEVATNAGSPPQFNLKTVATAAFGPAFSFINTKNGANGDGLGQFQFIGNDAAGGIEQFGAFQVGIENAAVGSEAGSFSITVRSAGTAGGFASAKMDGSLKAFVPNVDGNFNYGTNSLRWFSAFFAGAISLKPPAAAKTANYTVVDGDTSIVFNASATLTLTLLAAASFIGRILMVKNFTAQAINSASSNVCPLTSATAGTAILATTDRWAILQSDGTNWVIMAKGA